jgi:hypothetical protein
MRNAETILGIIRDEYDLLESRMMRKYQVRFGGGPMEKDWQGLVPRQRPTLFPDGTGGSMVSTRRSTGKPLILQGTSPQDPISALWLTAAWARGW